MPELELVQLQLDLPKVRLITAALMLVVSLEEANIPQVPRNINDAVEALHDLGVDGYNELMDQILKLALAGFSDCVVIATDTSGNQHVLCNHCKCESTICCMCGEVKA